MDIEKFLKEIKILKNTETLNIEKLPEIPLYMDQITTFIEEKLANFNRDKTQKNLTKAMINNYSKNKVIEPPEKKKYSKNHLISLILIYHLKSILSINDISSLLKNINGKEEEIYSYFVEKQKNQILEIEKNISEILKNNENNEDTLLYLMLDLIIDSNIKKLLVEKILDNYYNN